MQQVVPDLTAWSLAVESQAVGHAAVGSTPDMRPSFAKYSRLPFFVRDIFSRFTPLGLVLCRRTAHSMIVAFHQLFAERKPMPCR